MSKTYLSPSFISKPQSQSLCSVLNWMIATAASALLHFSFESQNIRLAAYWAKDMPSLAKSFSFPLHIHNKSIICSKHKKRAKIPLFPGYLWYFKDIYALETELLPPTYVIQVFQQLSNGNDFYRLGNISICPFNILSNSQLE